jgi:predicted phosphodiesterase
MKLLILGDCHGHYDLVSEACQAAELAHGVEAAIQVGDFGLFPKLLHRLVSGEIAPFPIPIHVIDGNHEDHSWIFESSANGHRTAWENANLHFHPRGTTMEIGGARIGFIGGALHADRRQEWADMWKPSATSTRSRRIPEDPTWANWVTVGDLRRALSAFSENSPDLIVSHSCPAGIGIGMTGSQNLIEDADRFIARPGFHAGPFHDCGEGNLTRLWRELSRKPMHWIFGHFHVMHDRTIDGTRFVCVGSTDDSDGINGVRPVIYDTQQKSLWVDVAKRLS